MSSISQTIINTEHSNYHNHTVNHKCIFCILTLSMKSDIVYQEFLQNCVCEYPFPKIPLNCSLFSQIRSFETNLI